MQEFRFHGRGGQGVVVLNKLVARLFFRAGKHVKEFPKFGVERRGAPVEGYLRVDDVPIELACQIYHPGAIIVMAESILDNVDVTAGMEPGSLVLVNTGRPATALGKRLGGFKVATVDASSIALGHGLGTVLTPIANTALFGAFTKLMGITAAEIEPAINAELKRPGHNADAAKEAFKAVNEPVILDGTAEPRPAKKSLYKSLEDLPPLAYSSIDARTNKTGTWRSSKPQFAFKQAPCNDLCPAGNDVRGFLEALAHEDPQKALEILLKTTPLPGVCGRVCPHPCEDQCNRTGIDGAVPVMSLERFAAAHGGDVPIPVDDSTHQRVAIIGSGPAGLSAAWQLARRGNAVTVFEAAPHPGGMLILGIPAFRLPRDIIDREIKRITSLGVEIRCDATVGEDVTLAELRDDFDAVLIAAGQVVSRSLGMEGEDHDGLRHGLDFLREHNLGGDVEVGEHVVVIGGGNTAVDVAGVSLRKSTTRDVTIVYRRTREQMPAIPEEVEQVLLEGVKLIELTSPVAIETGKEGQIIGLRCEVMKLAAQDASGRPRPVPTGERVTIPCDQVILATGQASNLEFAHGVEVAGDGIHTNVTDVFMAGDAADGAGTVTAAIGSGYRSAVAIHQSLDGALPADEPAWAPRSDEVLQATRIRARHFRKVPRGVAPRLEVPLRLEDFAEVIGEMPHGCREAGRCLSCGTCTGCDRCYSYCPEPAVSRKDGVYSIDLEYCKGCGICFEECPRGVVDMVEEGA